jgi:hypothetical protein
MPDDMRTQAAAYVDSEFRRTQDDLFSEHRRQEQRQLSWHKASLQSFARNREAGEQRYVQRLRSIEQKRDHIAERLHRQHNSIGGRLEALTKKGRARQADQLARLDDRAAALTARATRQFEALKERQFEAEQRDRISYAQQLKFFRLDHYELRQQQAKHHEATREQKIDDRVQAMRQTAERNLRQELQRVQSQDQQQARGRSPGH